MFPFYFGLDLVNVSILVSVKPLSFEFFALVFSQEVMGLCRNCGIYDIVTWMILKAFGSESAGEFLLHSVEFLEELAVIAGVDSVSEILATFGLLSLTFGELLASWIFPSVKACGLVNGCDEHGEPEREVVHYTLF